MVRNVAVITWKTPEYLVPRKEFFGIRGQSFLKPYNSEEWDPYTITNTGIYLRFKRIKISRFYERDSAS
jgi:hypothetical protein